MNPKKFYIESKKKLINLNNKKYYLNENILLKILKEDRLYKLYNVYLKKENIKHSKKELFKFLNYYCQAIANIKKENSKYNKLSIAQSSAAIVPVSPAPLTAPTAKPQNKSWTGKAGGGLIFLNIFQGLTETFYRCDTLIESAEEIIEQLDEYNEDYGFGSSQPTANQLLSNLKLMISLFPSISEAISDKDIDMNKINNKHDDINKFMTALKETEVQLQVINSYLIENKGGLTKTVEILKSIGVSPFETDTLSAVRAIGDFYTHVGAYKTILERALKAYDEQVKKIEENNKDSMNPSESLTKTTYRNKSNLSEFADIIF